MSYSYHKNQGLRTMTNIFYFLFSTSMYSMYDDFFEIIQPAILFQIIGGSYSVITLIFLTSLVSVLFFTIYMFINKFLNLILFFYFYQDVSYGLVNYIHTSFKSIFWFFISYLWTLLVLLCIQPHRNWGKQTKN